VAKDLSRLFTRQSAQHEKLELVLCGMAGFSLHTQKVEGVDRLAKPWRIVWRLERRPVAAAREISDRRNEMTRLCVYLSLKRSLAATNPLGGY
jgi:hypothetical protein